MDFTDTLILDAPRKTSSGYMAATVKAARIGIQVYSGREVDPTNKHGLRDRAEVRIYRPEESVFHKDSLATLAHKPITVNHPPVNVTADNWRDYAVGSVGDEIARDGDFIRVPVAIMDGKAIRAINDGKNQLSCGYSCDLVFGDGTAPNGDQYDAIQTDIRYNHLSVVDLARGGPELKIGDSQVTTKPVQITLDGTSHTVDLSDAAAILVGSLQTKLADAQTQVGTLTAAVSTKDGEIAVLRQQVADNAMTPAKLDAAVAERAKVIDAAKKIFPALVADGKDLAAIRKEAVVSKIADAATMDDNAISGAFSALVAIAPTVKTNDSLAHGLSTVEVKDAADEATKARNARYARFGSAHLGQSEKAN